MAVLFLASASLLDKCRPRSRPCATTTLSTAQHVATPGRAARRPSGRQGSRASGTRGPASRAPSDAMTHAVVDPAAKKKARNAAHRHPKGARAARVRRDRSAGISCCVANLGERVPELALCRRLVGTQDPHVRSPTRTRDHAASMHMLSFLRPLADSRRRSLLRLCWCSWFRREGSARARSELSHPTYVNTFSPAFSG